MAVNKRSSGSWVVQVYDPATQRMRSIGTYRSLRDARRAERDATRRPNGRATVADWRAEWLADLERRGRKASTVTHYRQQTRPFAQEHGHLRVDRVDRPLARAWAREKHGTASLRAMFAAAHREDLTPANPFASLGLTPRRKRDLRSEWLTADDITRLEACARQAHPGPYGRHVAALVRFAALTGLRTGELLALRWDCLAADTIEVRATADSKNRVYTLPKNGQRRTVALPTAAARAVRDMPRAPGEHVFHTTTGRPMWAPSLAYAWHPVRAAFGRPDMHLYELRHYCATRLLEAGLRPDQVAVQLGHTDNGGEVLRTYGHPSEREARERVLAVA